MSTEKDKSKVHKLSLKGSSLEILRSKHRRLLILAKGLLNWLPSL